MNTVNLNHVRKAKKRAEKKKRADENAGRFGLNKLEKNAAAAENNKLRAQIDAKKLDINRPEDKVTKD